MSNRSGIGDRIMDIILMYTFAQHLNCELYLLWNDESYHLMGDNNNYASKMRFQKTPYRSEDFKYKNLIKYISFPNNLNFINELQMFEMKNNNNNFIFPHYLGMQYSPFTFLDKFIPEYTYTDTDKNIFIKNYLDNFSNIKFKNIPPKLIDLFTNKKIITVHLRRSDKVNNDPDAVGVNLNEIKNLDIITEKIINYFINQGLIDIFFVSDEKKVKYEYYEKFKTKCNALIYDTDDISQTYIDLYCIAFSYKIIMSQNFSAFSLLGSFINQTELYYIYNNYYLNKLKFNRFNHIKSITELNL